MKVFCRGILISSLFVLSQILSAYGQGFGPQFSPFGQQAFGGNVFVPQNFPRPIEQTIDIERQGSFTLSPPDGSQGVQLLETTVTDGNRVIFQEGGGEQGGSPGGPPGQNFGQQRFPPPVQGRQQTTFITRPGMTGFPNPNPQVRIIQDGNTGNPFPGIQLPTASVIPFQGVPNTNPFLGPPATPTGNLVNDIITGLPGPLPTAIPNTQVNLNQGLPTGQFPGNQRLPNNPIPINQGMPGNQFQGNQVLPGTQFQGNQGLPGPQFQGNQGLPGPQFQRNQGLPGPQFQTNQVLGNTQFPQSQNVQGQLPGTQFQGIQTNQQFQANVLPTGVPNTNEGLANAVNSITGSDTFNSRFNLVDPITNAAVPEVSNSGFQNQQGQQFGVNRNFQQPPSSQNNIFGPSEQQLPSNQLQFQQGQFSQPANQFTGSFNSRFNRPNPRFDNSLGTNAPQFIGNQGAFLPRSEFTNSNDIRSSSNRGTQQNFTQAHPQDPSIGILLTDELLNGLDSKSSEAFNKFGQRGFTDISAFDPRPTPFPNVMNTPPGFTGRPGFTMSSPPTTTEGYKCQHSPCPKGQACVYDGKYKCPDWITLLDCKCLSGCMYNNWFIPKKFVIPIDHCGNHCTCERDDGEPTCSKTKCPDAP